MDLKIVGMWNVPANSIKILFEYQGSRSAQWFECPTLKSQWTHALRFRMTKAIKKAELQFSHETARRVKADKAVYDEALEWLRVAALDANTVG